MERSAKEAKKEKKSASQNTASKEYTALVVDSVRGSKESLKKLVEAGCQKDSVIRDLHLYCGGRAEDADWGLKSARQFADRVKKTSKRLKAVADEIDKLQEKLKSWIEFHFHKSLTANMRDLSEEFEITSKGLKHSLRNVERARSPFLIRLAYIVKAATGDWHYNELWQLVQAVKIATQTDLQTAAKQIFRPNEIKLGADSVRNTVNRCEEDYPMIAYLLLEEAKEEVAGWFHGPHAAPAPLQHVYRQKAPRPSRSQKRTGRK